MTYWTRERIVEAIQWWAREHGEPPAMADLNPYDAAVSKHDVVRAVRAERLIVERRVPTFQTVIERFGSWNAGLIAAGFPARPAHGGGGNEQHRRREWRVSRG